MSFQFRCKNIYLMITNNCNLHCSYCCENSGVPEEELSDEEIYNLLDECVKKKIEYIHISGGEPTLRNNFYDIIDYILDNNIKVIVYTNLVNVENKFFEYFKNDNFQIQTSLDSNIEAVHDKFRGKGSFRKTITNLNKIKELGYLDKVILTNVITKSNYLYFEEFLNYFIENGYSDITFKFNFLMKDGRSDDDFFNKNRISTNIYLELLKTKLKYSNKNIKINNFVYEGGNCGIAMEIPDFFPKILYNGDVYLCQGFRDTKYRVGNIKSNDLFTVLGNYKSQDLVNQCKSFLYKNYQNKCFKCPLHKIKCIGGCFSRENIDSYESCKCKQISYVEKIKLGEL